MKAWKENNLLREAEIEEAYHLTSEEVDMYIYEAAQVLAQELINKNKWAGKTITKARATYPFFWNFGNCITKVEERIKDEIGCYEDLPEDLEMYLHDEVPYVFWDALKRLSDKDSVWNNVTEKDLRLDGWRVEK